MPLMKGTGRDIISKNISELIRSGRPRKQAAAIAYSQGRKGGASLPRKGGSKLSRMFS